MESYGVLLYAKAFIRVFRTNQLVSNVETKKALDYCEILEDEVNQMTASQRTLVNALITKHNPIISIRVYMHETDNYLYGHSTVCQD